VEEYWRQKQLGRDTVVPPDKDGVRWSLVSDAELSDAELRRALGVSPDVDLPEVRSHPIMGLRDVVNTDPVVSASWRVHVGGRTPVDREVVVLERQQPLDKSLYEDAVRAADRFLFDMGIGVHVEPRPHKSKEPGI